MNPLDASLSSFSRRGAAVVWWLLVVGRIRIGDAWAAPPPLRRPNSLFRTSERINTRHSAVYPLGMVGDLIADLAVTVGSSPDYHTAGIVAGDKVVDSNGKEFTEGGVVRVCVEGLKAYQINAKGQGMFDATKAFIPDLKKKYLILPIGLRGTVMKVYDESIVSANLPIQVKFIKGEHVEEGYDTPTSFLMHFMPNEVECV